MPKSTSVDVQARFLSALLQEHEGQPRALLLAQQITEMLPGAAVVVYLLEQGEESAIWSPKAAAGDLRVDDAIPVHSGTLGFLAKESQALLLSGANLVREDYAHLHARRTLLSLACVPIMVNQNLIGAVEAASFVEVLRSCKPQQDQILVVIAQRADQEEYRIVGNVGSFQVQNDGFDRDLGQQRQDLFARAQKRRVEDRREYFFGGKAHGFIAGHNRMRDAAPVGMLSIKPGIIGQFFIQGGINYDPIPVLNGPAA